MTQWMRGKDKDIILEIDYNSFHPIIPNFLFYFNSLSGLQLTDSKNKQTTTKLTNKMKTKKGKKKLEIKNMTMEFISYSEVMKIVKRNF